MGNNQSSSSANPPAASSDNRTRVSRSTASASAIPSSTARTSYADSHNRVPRSISSLPAIPESVAANNSDNRRSKRVSRSTMAAMQFQTINDNYSSIEQVQAALRRQGLESSNLIVAVDFTKSNEWTGMDTFGGKSLHHISASLNPYEEVITIIGKTLRTFDDDGLIPAYGFGDATTGDRQVFSFLPKDQPCEGLEGVVWRYRELVPHVRLAGPTSFAPAIRQAMDVVAASGGQYHILLLIADGQVTRSSDLPPNERSVQEQDTVDAIVEASNYPLSIILVGVGDGPWDLMHEFDDQLPQRTFDNFQFVDYASLALTTEHHRREAAFALHALMEIPEQYRAIQRLRLLNKQYPRQQAATRDPPGPPPATVPLPPAAPPVHMQGPPAPAQGPTTYRVPPNTNPTFLCPITKETMMDPVIASDGHTYERYAIEQWLQSRNTSPITNNALPSLMLIPNHSLRSLILEANALPPTPGRAPYHYSAPRAQPAPSAPSPWKSAFGKS